MNTEDNCFTDEDNFYCIGGKIVPADRNLSNLGCCWEVSYRLGFPAVDNEVCRYQTQKAEYVYRGCSPGGGEPCIVSRHLSRSSSRRPSHHL